MDFKLASGDFKLAHVIAYSHEVDEGALKKLHLEMRGGGEESQWGG